MEEKDHEHEQEHEPIQFQYLYQDIETNGFALNFIFFVISVIIMGSSLLVGK